MTFTETLDLVNFRERRIHHVKAQLQHSAVTRRYRKTHDCITRTDRSCSKIDRKTCLWIGAKDGKELF